MLTTSRYVRSKILRSLDSFGRDTFYEEEQQPIVGEIRASGVDIIRLHDLLHSSADAYVNAVGILVRHLAMDYSDATIETIARALATKKARPYWREIAARYREQPSVDTERAYPSGAKDGLALALAEICTDQNMDELVELARDTRNGRSRAFFLKVLRRSDNSAARAALEELRSDTELSANFDRWLRRR